MRQKLYPYFVWSLGALFFLMEYFIRVSPSVITTQLMSTFHIAAFALGGLSAFFYYAYISMQVPVGILVDRFGPKRLLTASIAICALSIVLFAGMRNIETGYLSRLLMGFGASFAFVGTLKLISTWFPARQFALLAGVTQALGMLGAVIGDAPMAYIFQTYGWRQSLMVIAGIFALLAIFIGLFVRDTNPRLPAHEAVSKDTIKIWPSVKMVMANPQTWLNCLFIGLLYAPTAAFGEQWGVAFISNTHHIDNTHAAGEVSAIFIGMAIGCPLLGWLSDRLQRRLIVMRVAAVACLALILIVIYGERCLGIHLSEKAFFAVLFGYGLFNSGIVPSYALASEINPRKLTGIALGITNMASVIIGAIFIPLIGLIMDKLWDGTVLNGIRLYSAGNYQLAFVLLPTCFVIAIIVSLFLHETHCQHQHNH